MDKQNVELINTRSILPLQVEGISLTSGHTQLLSDISFSVRPGSRVMVLGPNGAGKSLLLRVLHGLVKPSSGQVNWARLDAEKSQAMVFQRPVLLRRSAIENISFALNIAALAAKATAPAIARKELANQALARVGLSNIADRPARLCSVGEQQRIALARAWAVKPEVLFLDEPTASLDPTATKAVEEIIQAMHAAGTTIVMATHDLGQARRLGDQALVLHRGQLISNSSCDELFNPSSNSPQHSATVRAFLQGDLLWQQ